MVLILNESTMKNVSGVVRYRDEFNYDKLKPYLTKPFPRTAIEGAISLFAIMALIIYP